MKCRLVERYRDAYVDGEVDPTTAIELEHHLAACTKCQEGVAFTRGFKAQVRDALEGAHAPATLRDRIIAALDEVDRERAEQGHPFVRVVTLRARYAVPLAAAAAVLMAVGWSLVADEEAGGQHAHGEPPVRSLSATTASASTSIPIFEDVVRVHTNDLPADVRGEQPQEVTNWFRNKVSFPVRPAEFERNDARLLGARLSNVRERGAAALFYDVGGSRVTVVVFDRPSQPLGDGLRRTHLLGREVRYQQVGGYVVPVREQSGITYAFTGDLDRGSLLRLAATAHVRY